MTLAPRSEMMSGVCILDNLHRFDRNLRTVFCLSQQCALKGFLDDTAANSYGFQVLLAGTIKEFFVVEIDNGIVERYAVLALRIHRRAYYVRIAGDDGAVEGVFGVVEFVFLVGNYRVEYAVGLLRDSPSDVSVDDFCRETDVVAHNSARTGLVHRHCGRRRENHF